MKKLLEVSNPTSTFRIIWEVISMFFIFVQMIYIPMALSFSVDTPYGMDIFNNMMDIFFVIDLLLNFKLAYYHKYIYIINAVGSWNIITNKSLSIILSFGFG